jgi:hypothetical protein
MQKDERDLLEVLKSELEFLEHHGYRRSPETAWRPKAIFEDSPSCINFHSAENPRPCTDCALIYLVPPRLTAPQNHRAATFRSMSPVRRWIPCTVTPAKARSKTPSQPGCDLRLPDWRRRGWLLERLTMRPV